MNIEEILFGTKTLASRWKKSLLNSFISPYTWIDPTVIPDEQVIAAIQSLDVNQTLRKEGYIMAAHLDKSLHNRMIKNQSTSLLENLESIPYDHSFDQIHSLQYIIEHNKHQIIADWENDIKNDNWATPSQYKNTFVAPDVYLPQVTIDDRQGPVIIYSGTTILSGAKIMGPTVILSNSLIKMGAELYPGCTIGSHATVSGEIKNSIIHSYSAKGHSGYLGDSILGRWNNFGAGTTVSNVSNTFSKVKFDEWNTGAQVSYDTVKRGLITGDFVKLGIMSKVYRGTSIGSFSNITVGEAIKGKVSEMTWWTEDQQTRYDSIQLRIHCKRQMELYGQTWTNDWENALSKLESIHKNTNTLSK